jgi:hypothetical protein
MRVSQKTDNLAVPLQGSRIVPVDLDFTATGSNGLPIAFDLAQEEERGALDMVQSVFIDNSLNAQSIRLTLAGVGGAGHTIGLPANFQGYFPLPVEGIARFTASTTGLIIIPMIFYNVALPYFVWKAQ